MVKNLTQDEVKILLDSSPDWSKVGEDTGGSVYWNEWTGEVLSASEPATLTKPGALVLVEAVSEPSVADPDDEAEGIENKVGDSVISAYGAGHDDGEEWGRCGLAHEILRVPGLFADRMAALAEEGGPDGRRRR